jgi:transposase
MSRHGSNYPPEVRERAVRMVAEVQGDYPSQWAAITAVASKLGIGSSETLRTWVRRAEVDGGARPGITSEERAEIKALKQENAELRRANEILKAASTFFAAELCATRRRVDRGRVRDRSCWVVAAA